MAIRDGFIIPNAATVAPNYQASQPDQGDFLVLGNSRNGVITGCKVSLASYVASVGTSGSSDPHLLVVGGSIFSIDGGSSVALSGQGTDGRFDLIVFDKTIGLTVVAGSPTANPVFPDITDDMVVLAAVFVPASGASNSPVLIDKRSFLQQSLVGVNLSTNDIITSYVNSGSGSFKRLKVGSDGKISWGGGTADTDTVLERIGAGSLKVSDTLQAKNLRATETLRLNNYDVVTSERIGWGTNRPENPSAGVGTVYVNTTNGNIDVFKSSGWSTVGSTIAAGTVIMSFSDPADMPGWLPLIGQTVSQITAGNLWDMFPSWRSGTNVVLPDLRGRMPIGAGLISVGQPGVPGTDNGTRTDDKGSMSITMSRSQMPKHSHQRKSIPRHHDDDDDDDDDEDEDHSISSYTAYQGLHDHSGSTNVGGSHTHSVGTAGNHAHPVQDLQHVHNFGSDRVVVASAAGADTCLDIIFNDASHSHTTKPRDNTGAAKSNVYVDWAGSHSHGLTSEASHSHAFTIEDSGYHRHSVPQHYSEGGGQPITFRPPTMSIYFYIKT